MEKRTDKTKRRTVGGFYSNFKRWDTRGKGSKELKEMVEDLKNCITHQLVRIRKHKFVIELLKTRDNNKVALQKLKTTHQLEEKKLVKQKLVRREEKIESLDEAIKDLDFIIKEQDKEIAKLNRELEKKEDLLDDVKSIKQTVIKKEVQVQLTPEAKRVQKIADNGVDTRVINHLEYTTRTLKFLKENNLTLEYLSVITQAELLGNVKTKDIGATYKLLNKIVSLGYLQSNNGLVGASKYWFVSLKGKELLKNYKNILSYGKSVLNT